MTKILSNILTKLVLTSLILLIVLPTQSCAGKQENKLIPVLTATHQSVEFSLSLIEGSKLDKNGKRQCDKYAEINISPKMFEIYGEDLPKCFASMLGIPEMRIVKNATKLPTEFVSLEIKTEKDSLGDLLPIVKLIAEHFGVDAELKQDSLDAQQMSVIDTELLQTCLSELSEDQKSSNISMTLKTLKVKNANLAELAKLLENSYAKIAFLEPSDELIAEKRYSFSLPADVLKDEDLLEKELKKVLGIGLVKTKASRQLLYLSDK